jgi:DNA-binding MarR family transcriptional regulator
MTKAPDLFFRLKPTRILVSLNKGPKYATIVAKEVDCTYSHVVKLLDTFSKLGLVRFEKRGRIKTIHLTEAGKRLADKFEDLLAKLSELKK